jgi:hypothetical protein
MGRQVLAWLGFSYGYARPMSSLIKRLLSFVDSAASACRLETAHVASFGLLALLCSCEAPKVMERPIKIQPPTHAALKALLTHEPSGIKFFPRVAALGRKGSKPGVNKGASVRVSYACSNEEFQAGRHVTYPLVAMIVVTPASDVAPDALRAREMDELLKEHPDAEHETISGLHGDADYLVYRPDSSEFPHGMAPSKVAFNIAHPRAVELHAFQHGGYTISYLFTFPAFKRNDFSKMRTGFMKTFEAQQGW